jgi:hypothetical protein
LFDEIEFRYTCITNTLQDVKTKLEASVKHSSWKKYVGIIVGVLGIIGVGSIIVLGGPICWLATAGCALSIISSTVLFI